MTSIDYRKRLADLMTAILEDESTHHDWTYHAVRPMYVPNTWVPGQRVVGDCSKGVQYLCKWAGSPVDPMMGGWGPYGNSGTLWLHCQHLDHASDLLVGDFVTYGNYGSEHAEMVLQPGGDPLDWSFGHQGAPNTRRPSTDWRPMQFLRNPLPNYVPTPDDRLRAKTGYFAWMQWCLGEGGWKGKGKNNPSVRPDVPTRIPVDWWVARVKFLAARNKGNKPTTKGK